MKALVANVEAKAGSGSQMLEPGEFGGELGVRPDQAPTRVRVIERVRLLWQQRRVFVRFTAWGLALSMLLAFAIPKHYESTARLMPPDPQSGAGLGALAALTTRSGALAPLAGDLLGLKSSSALFVGILRSRTVQDRLIEQFHLKEVYGKGRMEDARAELGDQTRISEDRKNGIITVTVTDKDPQRATAMASSYVQELDRLVADVSTSSARRERIFLEQRLQSVKQELDAAAQDFSQFASKNTAIDIKEQGRAMVEAAATLQGQLISAETELQGLRQIYTDGNVRVRAVRARIAELQRQLEKVGGKDVGTEAETAGGQSLYPSIRKLPLLGVTYADLFRRTKVAEVVFELLTQQYELAKVQEAKEIPTVKVLDTPVLPESRSFPPRLAIVVLGSSFAGLVGMAWIVTRDRWAALDGKDPAKLLGTEILSDLMKQRESSAWGLSRWIRYRLGRPRKPVRPEAGQSPE